MSFVDFRGQIYYNNYFKYCPYKETNLTRFLLKFLRLTVLLSCLSGSLALLGANWLWRPGAFDKIDETVFVGDALYGLNENRELACLPFLQADNELRDWLRFQIDQVPDAESIGSQALIEKLQEQNPSIAGASVYIVYARKPEDLIKKLSDWSGTLDDELTHFAARLFKSPGYRGIGCVALMAEKLPLFSPALLSSKADTFYNYCAICKRPHLGKISAASRSIVLECPLCSKKYDLLAVSMKGDYRRVNDYLLGFEPQVLLPETKTRRDELYAVWNSVLEHCRYQKDFAGAFGQRDSWQTPVETHRYANGDCEDTSILLADWLISRGFDARVALGRTDRYDGHAWCVVELDGEQYILETTDTTPDPRTPPLVGNIGRHYHPEFLFDREAIYFRRNKGWVSDYWTDNAWIEVTHGGEVIAPGEVASRR